MKKILEISTCHQCKWYSTGSKVFTTSCYNPKLDAWKQTKTVRIPKWCPLPNVEVKE